MHILQLIQLLPGQMIYCIVFVSICLYDLQLLDAVMNIIDMNGRFHRTEVS